jgi:shikimate kinase
MKSDKIILLGYMGSGKSLIGSQLAKALDFQFKDLDDFIEETEGKQISAIFQSKGELYFRTRERACLETLLQSSQSLVISLGGGTPCYFNNMEYLQGIDGLQSFFLSSSIQTLSERLFKEKDSRPLISHIRDMDQLREFIGKHLFERNPYYQKAQNQIKVDYKTANEIVSEIKNRLT